MKIEDLRDTAGNLLKSSIVYAEPLEKNGITVIAAASVAGGGGFGNGHDENGQGEGGGLGVRGKPAGAFVVKGDRVRWQPAIDVNRLIAVVGAIAVVALLVGGRIAQQHAH
ncbi:sporulation protein [Antrihabitans sp. YC2-6]|uniref:sporulation protein n=1 Tax=Antrihabitans sp. YC2-6 TaxID=2799498 RepID=UPI0018F70EB1|nr:sporulation protein [Antrihabitans sp. YC2-6]MBJ8347043.1 sporulation protein [Antrihabitans sp. YC2-6]